MGDRIIPYDENYIEEVFVFWYAQGRPAATKLIEHEDCPLDQYKRKPVRRIVEAWVNERGWRERADVLDARAATQIEDELVALKVNALRKQAAMAAAVLQKSFEHILENPFDSSASAISAFFKSAELQRVVLGVSKQIERLAQMDDDEVIRTVKELAERSGSTTIDAAEVPEEEDENVDTN